MGAQSLSDQIYIFNEEAIFTQEKFLEVFTKHNETINGLPDEMEIIDNQFVKIADRFGKREVANFENYKQVDTKTSSNLTCFQDGIFGPYT